MGRFGLAGDQPAEFPHETLPGCGFYGSFQQFRDARRTGQLAEELFAARVGFDAFEESAVAAAHPVVPRKRAALGVGLLEMPDALRRVEQHEAHAAVVVECGSTSRMFQKSASVMSLPLRPDLNGQA